LTDATPDDVRIMTGMPEASATMNTLASKVVGKK
jgi:hypothetical protein